jgi:hypothetical protein
LKGALAPQSSAKGQDDDIASTDFNDGEDEEMSVVLDPAGSLFMADRALLPGIAWNICSPFSRFVVSVTMGKNHRTFIGCIEKSRKASQANLKREFRALATEFRGYATTIVDEMNAYMRVSLHHDEYIRADTRLLETS